MVGPSYGAGQLLVSGRPTSLAYGRQGSAVLAAGAGRVGYFLYIYHLVYPIFLF